MIEASWNRTQCRACGGSLRLVLDLGQTPLANSLSETAQEAQNLPRYPLRMCTCSACMMVQLDVAVPSDVLFSHYVYETPRAASLEQHYERLIDEMWRWLGADAPPRSIFEMGSNNGEFLKALGRRSDSGYLLGIEPAKNIADAANAEGIETLVGFFSKKTVPDILEKRGQCDVFVARHCMAHLDDLRGTLEAVRDVLSERGVAVIENAYLVDTLNGTQFDQIYHEHMSYFALRPMEQLFARAGLHLRHAMRSPIHGGTIVMFASKRGGQGTAELGQLLEAEKGFERDLDAFAFRTRTCIAGIREGLRSFAFRTVDSYGATAKGNTLMNVIGPEAAHVRYAVDSTPSKRGKHLPGTGVKVISENEAEELRPDAYLLTAWNYEQEILAKQELYRRQGGRFIVPMPYPRLV